MVDLPIYEATAKEINLWHAYGVNVALQALLREYQLDISSPNVAAYNFFKIGLDTKRYRATFAIDDTHYFAIDFNQSNSAPLDRRQACRVLAHVQHLRISHDL